MRTLKYCQRSIGATLPGRTLNPGRASSVIQKPMSEVILSDRNTRGKHGMLSQYWKTPVPFRLQKITPLRRNPSMLLACQNSWYNNGQSNGMDMHQFRHFSGKAPGGVGGASDGAASSAGGGEDGQGDGDDDGVEVVYDQADQTQEYPTSTVALTSMTIPDYLPNIPVIAVNRNLCFPRFIKMIEVNIGITMIERRAHTHVLDLVLQDTLFNIRHIHAKNCN